MAAMIRGGVSRTEPTAWKRLLAGGLVIAVGVLSALFVDGIREKRLERRILNESPSDLIIEIEGNSGQLRLIRDRSVAYELADFNRAPAVLFEMADEIRGDYREVVHEILPPEMAPEVSQLRGYVPGSMADPAWFEGMPDYARTLRDLHRREDEVLALAQNEAAYLAAYVYALDRYRCEMSLILEMLEPRRPKVP